MCKWNKTTTLEGYLPCSVHCRTIHTSQVIESTSRIINRRIKKNMCYKHKGIAFMLEHWEFYDLHSMSEYSSHHFKWNKTAREGQAPHTLTYPGTLKQLIPQKSEVESQVGRLEIGFWRNKHVFFPFLGTTYQTNELTSLHNVKFHACEVFKMSRLVCVNWFMGGGS